jgi:hypothetical protein
MAWSYRVELTLGLKLGVALEFGKHSRIFIPHEFDSFLQQLGHRFGDSGKIWDKATVILS